MLEEGAVPTTAHEVLDGLDLMDAFAAIPKLGPAREVLAASFRQPLHAHGELNGTARTLVGKVVRIAILLYDSMTLRSKVTPMILQF